MNFLQIRLIHETTPSYYNFLRPTLECSAFLLCRTSYLNLLRPTLLDCSLDFLATLGRRRLWYNYMDCSAILPYRTLLHILSYYILHLIVQPFYLTFLSPSYHLLRLVQPTLSYLSYILLRPTLIG